MLKTKIKFIFRNIAIILALLYHLIPISLVFAEVNKITHNRIILNNASIHLAFSELKFLFHYDIEYKGPFIDRKITIEANDKSLKQCIELILFEAGINNFIFSVNEKEKIISIQALRPSLNYLPKQMMKDKKFSEMEWNGALTLDQIYLLREQTEKEDRKQGEMSKPLTFEQIETLTKIQNSGVESTNFHQNSLTPEQIDILTKQQIKYKLDPEPLSPDQLIKLKQHTIVDNGIDEKAIPLTHEQLKLLILQPTNNHVDQKPPLTTN